MGRWPATDRATGRRAFTIPARPLRNPNCQLETGNWKLQIEAPDRGAMLSPRRPLQIDILVQNGRKKPLSPQFPTKSHEVAHKDINWRKNANLRHEPQRKMSGFIPFAAFGFLGPPAAILGNHTIQSRYSVCVRKKQKRSRQD